MEDTLRKLPFSLPAEQSLLGSILIDPEAINQVADKLAADDFYLTEHKQIFLAMQELFLASRNIDVVTLIDMLVKGGVYDKSGGEDYLRTLAESVPDAMNLLDYAKIVKEKSVLRQLIAAGNEISELAYSEQDSVDDLLAHAETLVYNVAEGRNNKGFIHIRDVAAKVYAHLQQLSVDPSSLQGTKTGFDGLDRTLVGMGKGDFILVGARPGMGKTAFALNIATNVAKNTKKKVCIFSLEMSAEQLVTRIFASEATIDNTKLRTGQLQPEDWDLLARASGQLASCDILIDDTPGTTVSAIKAKLRREHENLGLVVIDYLGLMAGDHRSENRVQEVAEISRGLKLLAKEFEVPVICCAQLNRATEDGKDKKPVLSNLRDSGAIEQDADVVIFLYRSEYYKPDDTSGTNTAEIIVAKNRHGAPGTIHMGWNGQLTKFVSVDPNHPEAEK